MPRITLSRACFVALLALTLDGLRASAQDAFWDRQLTGTYSWDNGGNWVANLYPNGYPNGTDHGAFFPGLTTGNQTITTTGTSGTITVNRITINSVFAFNVQFNGMSLTFADPGSMAPTLSMGVAFENPNAVFGENRINTPVVISSSSLTVDQTNLLNNLRISGVISGGTGSSGLTKTGLGRLILDGNNTYTGTTTVSAGTLQIGNGGSSGTLSGPVTNNATLSFNRSDTALVFGSNITGTGALVHQGTGRVTLTGVSNYTGGTTVSAGTLQIGSGTAGSITGNIANAATVVFGRTDDTAYDGTISGTGQVRIENGGTMRFTADHTYAGATTVAAGSTLRLGNATNTGSVAGAIVNNGSLVVNRLNDATFNNAISGTGSVTKIGANTLTLDGANTYTGATTVSEGTLILGANALPSASSRLTVASGAALNVAAEPYVVGDAASPNQRLEGRGIVQATTLTVQGTGGNSGVVAPGIQGGSETVGTLTVQGDVAFAPGGTYEVSYNKLNGSFTAGTDNDLLESTTAGDTLDITATSTDRFRLRLNYTGTEEHNVTGDKELMISRFVGGVTNFAPSGDQFALEGDFGQPGTFLLELRNNDTELWLTFSPVPEPTTVLGIAALSLAGMGYLRRRLDCSLVK